MGPWLKQKFCYKCRNLDYFPKSRAALLNQTAFLRPLQAFQTLFLLFFSFNLISDSQFN